MWRLHHRVPYYIASTAAAAAAAASLPGHIHQLLSHVCRHKHGHHHLFAIMAWHGMIQPSYEPAYDACMPKGHAAVATNAMQAAWQVCTNIFCFNCIGPSTQV
jgi:hypothetical protein